MKFNASLIELMKCIVFPMRIHENKCVPNKNYKTYGVLDTRMRTIFKGGETTLVKLQGPHLKISKTKVKPKKTHRNTKEN